MTRKITISTIAKDLGVSVATVSRALNNSPKISERRRREIKDFARQRNFSLRKLHKRTVNLSILLCRATPDDSLFSTYTDQVISGAHRYCSEHDLELSFFSQTHERLNSQNAVKELYRRGVDGAIVLNAHDDSEFILSFEEERFPYCCTASGNAKFPDHILAVDNISPATQATELLIRLGHRHIAFMLGDPHSQAHLERLKGYSLAIEIAGLEKHTISTPATRGTESGFEETLRLLTERSEVTAIFSTIDTICDGVRAALYKLRLQIPQDLSIISCDNSVRAAYFAPPLTVIDLPNEQMGYMAAQHVHLQIEELEHTVNRRPVTLQGRLIIRESTAPPNT